MYIQAIFQKNFQKIFLRYNQHRLYLVCIFTPAASITLRPNLKIERFGDVSLQHPTNRNDNQNLCTMYTNQTEELRALSLQEMEETNGGHSIWKEISCGSGNVGIILSLGLGLASGITGLGLIAIGLSVVSAAAGGCYTPE